jgi:hypothetical protein
MAADSWGVMGMFWGLSAGVHVPCVRNSSMSGGRPAVQCCAVWSGQEDAADEGARAREPVHKRARMTEGAGCNLCDVSRRGGGAPKRGWCG